MYSHSSIFDNTIPSLFTNEEVGFLPLKTNTSLSCANPHLGHRGCFMFSKFVVIIEILIHHNTLTISLHHHRLTTNYFKYTNK